MAPHSTVLAWRIPGTAEPGGMPSMGSHRVEHDWRDLAAAAAAAGFCGFVFFFFPKCIAAWFIYMETYTYLEKAMAPHSSTFAWKIPWMAEPGRLQSMGSLRVGHNWATSLSLFTFMHWRRKWQPTPVFLPGESQGRGSLVDCSLWGRTESDKTEVT